MSDINEHDATEIAYKNGYKKGVMDVFAEIEKHAIPTTSKTMLIISQFTFAELKKKYTEVAE